MSIRLQHENEPARPVRYHTHRIETRNSEADADRTHAHRDVRVFKRALQLCPDEGRVDRDGDAFSKPKGSGLEPGEGGRPLTSLVTDAARHGDSGLI
ncbi:hypothetical protein EVAR_77218_1 [Eumeta japonica]|uniref:Uncharacterized protein n=1 Tax=Eumeta variegata TaxID=151549 RepID=A0A4C1T253_EUMVA|nr:hypothetical protein EVAR_77218_1 [Eumeta japonica]